jgi:hypothetical protein
MELAALPHAPHFEYLAFGEMKNITNIGMQSFNVSRWRSLKVLQIHYAPLITDAGLQYIMTPVHVDSGSTSSVDYFEKLQWVKVVACGRVSLGGLDSVGFQTSSGCPIVYPSRKPSGIGLAFRRIV